MAVAILRRKMMKMDSLLLGKTYSTSQNSLTTTKTIKSLLPQRNHPSFSFSFLPRNFITISGSSSKFPYEKDGKVSNWIVVPAGICGILGILELFVTPYCFEKPDIDCEDHVRYSYKLEPGVRQEDVKFKIVDNSVLELSYMYRHHKDPRVVNKELPKGNYANAEIRGWFHNKHGLFMVDIAGFERQPTEKLSDL